LFEIATRILLLLTAVLTAADWIRQRGRVRLQISLLFATLAAAILVGLLSDLGVATGRPGSLLAQTGLLAHPLILLWLVTDLHPVGKRPLVAATAAFLVLSLILGLSASSAPPLLTVLAVVYFVGVESVAAYLIIRLARNRQGVLRRRMVLVGLGSGLLAAAILTLGVGLLPDARLAWAQEAPTVLATASAACYYLGFVPPRWLRRAWLLAELERFLAVLSRLQPTGEARQMGQALQSAATRVVGAAGNHVGCHLPETSTLAFVGDIELTLEPELIQRLMAGASDHIPDLAQSKISLLDLDPPAGTYSAFLVPLHAGDTFWGALILFPGGRTLFPQDDLALLDLMARQIRLQLGYGALLEQERQLAQALRQQNDLLTRNALYLAQMRDPVWILDNNDVTVEINPAFEALFGYTRDEAVGMPIDQFFDGPNLAIIHTEFAKRARGESTTYEVEVLTKTGVPLPVIITGSPIIEQGRVIGKIGVVKDIRAQKEFEAELRQTANRLEAVNKELETFSYSVSHDLRSPLRAIDGFSRILIEEHGRDLSAEAQGYLDRIRGNAQRMGEMIGHLLSFSRLGRQAIDEQVVDLNQVVTEALEEVRSEWQGTEPGVRVHPLPVCRGDQQLLRRVFANLISNAAKFSREADEPQIEIGADTKNGSTVYYVRDNGVGFDMAYADKLFGVFQRLHRQEDYEGTGVGLATVQRIIHQHGGRIWPEAEAGRGATFFFTLGEDNSDDEPSN
jgi:PAS domain S-box-containing protein